MSWVFSNNGSMEAQNSVSSRKVTLTFEGSGTFLKSEWWDKEEDEVCENGRIEYKMEDEYSSIYKFDNGSLFKIKGLEWYAGFRIRWEEIKSLEEIKRIKEQFRSEKALSIIQICKDRINKEREMNIGG